MHFTYPWGLLALAALPAIVMIHLYRRRFPPLVVAGTHLWTSLTRQNLSGRKRERLPVSASLLLELLAALVLSLILSQPRLGSLTNVVHLVVVLDNSASMQGRPPGGNAPSFRDAAVSELERRIKDLPRGSVVTLIQSGVRPEMLAGPAVPWQAAQPRLAEWRPSASRHSFEPAWDLGLQLIEQSGQLLFLTDRLPDEKDIPGALECVSVGRRLDNVAINAARWTFDSATGQGTVFIRVQNQGREPVSVEVIGRQGDQSLFRQPLTLSEQGGAGFEVAVAGGLGQLTVELTSANDGLPIDNRAELIETAVRTVHVAIVLPEGESARLIRRVLEVLPDVQLGDADSANLVFAPAASLPESNARRWWVGIGPVSPEADDIDRAKDIAGPFLLEKRHPLLEGIVLGGVVWGGVQPLTWDVTPLISSARSILVGRLNGTRTVGYLLNIDLERSNLADSPDWPILLANLIELRRENLPGLQRWNYRLGEDVRFRLYEGESDTSAAGDALTLIHRGRSRTIARSSQIEIPAVDDPGVYELRSGSELVGRFAVNFHDAAESDLRNLVPGRFQPRQATPVATIALDNPYSWLLLGGVVIILISVLADWYVLRPARV